LGLDVLLCNALNRWPWLSDFSLLNTLASIFVPQEKATPAGGEPSQLPWTYINVVLENTQVILPVSRDLLKLSEALALLPQQQPMQANRKWAPQPRGNQALLQVASFAYRASRVPDTVSQDVVDHPAVFQLMSQV
jgi:hypothetical protein